MASRLHEPATAWAWLWGLVLATTVPMTVSFLLVRLGLHYRYRVRQAPVDVIPTGTQMQVTAPAGLPVRAQPRPDSPVVGNVAYQQTVERLAISADRQWEQVRLPALQVVGWVKAGHLHAPTPGNPPQAWVMAEHGLFLRQEPSTTAPVLTGLAYAQELRVLAHNADAGWTQVQIPATQTIGWVKSEYIRSTPPGEPPRRQVQVTSPTGLVLRQEPNGTPLATLAPGETLHVLRTSRDGQWLQVAVPATQQEGWVKAAYTQPR